VILALKFFQCSWNLRKTETFGLLKFQLHCAYSIKHRQEDEQIRANGFRPTVKLKA